MIEKLRSRVQNDREKEAEKGPGRKRRESENVGMEVSAIWEGGVGLGKRTAMEVGGAGRRGIEEDEDRHLRTRGVEFRYAAIT